MQNFAIKPFLKSVIILNAVMLSAIMLCVVAPKSMLQNFISCVTDAPDKKKQSIHPEHQ
jgi:hypothetical protein